MDIFIKKNIAYGIIRIPRWTIIENLNFINFINDADCGDYVTPLYHFAWNVWEDFETNTFVIKCRGSIISMLIFRKRILIQLPFLKGII